MCNRKTKNKSNIRSEEDLICLAGLLQQNHSLDIKTVSDARKTVNAGIYKYTFDSTTLLPYRHNLSYMEDKRLSELMFPFYQKMNNDDREAYKELCERRILLQFLLCAPRKYRKQEIKKEIRPDFVLTGNKRIGIEVTELTTPFDKNFMTLSREVQENHFRTDSEIEEHLQHYHKSIANKIELVNDNGIMLSTSAFDLDSKRYQFAELIKTKYNKYQDIIQQYDEFIILGNAAYGSGLEISKKSEVQEIIDYLLTECPDIVNVTTVIAWREAKQQNKIIFSWYKLTKNTT